MRREQPVVWHSDSDYPAFWSVSRYSDVRTVYERTDIFSSTHGVLLRPQASESDPGAGLTLALSDAPRHAHLRRALAPRFDLRCARGLSDVMRSDVRKVLASAAESGEFDFAHAVAGRLSSLLVARLLGVPNDDLDTVVRWIEEAFEAGTPMTSHSALIRYVIAMMDDRAVKTNTTTDIVSRLLDLDIDGELLDETEVILNCENLLGASENAGLSMAAGMSAFLENPSAWETVVADFSVRPGAVEEILRWGSSATHSMRTATVDTTLRGCNISAGDRVVVWVRSANRDEKEFVAPHTFDIRRTPNRHLALGFGPHVCIGQTFARHQTRMLIDELASTNARFVQTGPITGLASIAVNGPARLPMRMVLEKP